MAKIPVGKTVQYAYTFTFGGLLNLLGVGWIGFAILGAANYLFMRPYMSAFAAFQTTRNFGQLASVFPLALLYFIVTMVVYAMIKVVVLRQALGLSTERHTFYFSMNKPVWRLLIAYLLFAVTLIGIMIGCSIALGILAVIVGFGVGAISGTPATGAAAAVLLTPLVYVVLIYFLLRFGFLLSTIVIAQDKIALGQSWRLSRGNFWRILAIGLATYVPAIIIYYILLAVVGVNFLPPIHPGVTPDELAAWNGRLMASLRSPMPALFYVFYLLLTTGLTSAASAFAYRALVPPSEGIAAEFA